MKNIIRRALALFICVLVLTSVYLPVASKEDGTSFDDVKSTHWFYDAVTYVASNEIMVGMKENIFAPNVSFTRAMTVQVLSQISGDDLSVYTDTDFPDVPDNAWFKKAVAWAVDKEIVVGINGMFKPYDDVTREQLSRMIHQFAVKYEITNMFPSGNEGADSFADAKKIGAWAKADMDWTVDNGIITGMGNNTLSPKGTATRAQAAQIFYYLHYMKTEKVLPPDTTDYDALTVTESDTPRILCWGDSMTHGYPTFLRPLAKVPVKNYSAGGDTAEHIAMKQGALPFYATPFTIPASNDPVKVVMVDENYNVVESIADLGGSGLTPVTIAGITGMFYHRYEDDGECYYFKRTESNPQNEIKVTRLTRIVTSGMKDQKTGDIHIIFSGPSNGYKYDEAYKLIETQQRMIDDIGHDKYLIISLTSLYYLPQIWEFNADLAEYYGDHFLDFRTYLLEHGLEDAGITPTEQDLADLAIGEIPSSFRSDEEHGNDIYNELLAQQIYKRLVELGYLEAA